MSFLIGRGRYASQIYPQSPGAAGGGGGVVPLSRQRFIDGGTTLDGLTGAAAAPFRTIAQFMAARGNNSVADALNSFIGWLMPAIGGYIEDVAFPAYATTILSATAPSASNIIGGDVRWDNVAGANTPANASAHIHNVNVTGSWTITDDPAAPLSAALFTADVRGSSLASFVSSATTRLNIVFFEGVVVGSVDAGTAVDSAEVIIADAAIAGGAITAKAINARGSAISSPTIDLNDNAIFLECTFAGNTVLSAPNGARFDGPSWRSFQESGGTRGGGTNVLVAGGYSGGNVEGGEIGADSSVSLSGAGASAGFEDGGNHYTVDGTPTTITLLNGGALEGDTMMITKPASGANAVAINNAAAATLATIPTNERGFVMARFSGADWVLEGCGSTAA